MSLWSHTILCDLFDFIISNEDFYLVQTILDELLKKAYTKALCMH